MAGHPNSNGPPFRGAGRGRGRGTPNFKFHQLINGGSRVGIHSTGSGPTERRYEDYQPNLEPGAYCDAPPEIRSVPPPPPPPQPYRRPTFDPNHNPGMSRKRKFQQAQPPPPPPKPLKKKRGKKGSSRSDSPLSAAGGGQGKGNQLAQFAQVNQASQIAAGNVSNVASATSPAAKGSESTGSTIAGAPAQRFTAPSVAHGQQRPTSWQQNNRDRAMDVNTASGNGAFQSKGTYQNHYDRRAPYHVGHNRSDPRFRNNVSSTVSDQQTSDLTLSRDNPEPPVYPALSINDTTDPVAEPTAQQKQQWKAQVMAGHAKPDHRKGNALPSLPGHSTSVPAQRHPGNSFVSPSSGNNAASGVRPSTAGTVPQNRQPPVYATQAIPDQRKRKEPPPHAAEQRTPGILAHRSEPSMNSLSLTNIDRTGVRQSVSNDRQRNFAPPAAAQQPSTDQRRRHDSSTTAPAQVTTRPQIQSVAPFSPPPDRMLLVPSISFSATTAASAPRTFQVRRATPEEPVAAPIPKPLQRVRRIMTPPGSELSLEERMNNDAIEDELEIIPYLPTTSTRTSEDEVRVSSRSSTDSISSVHVTSPVTTNSAAMEDEDEHVPALDEKQDDGEFEEQPRILSRLPANYARERKRATPAVSVDRNKGQAMSRGSASSDVTGDTSLPVTSSSSLVRGHSEQARAEASEGFSTVLSTSSPAQTEAHILSAMLPDLSIEIDEKQEYVGGGDLDMDDGVERRRELEAGAEFFPMPAGCARSASGNQGLLRENRRLFVRAQTVRLENECRVVKRTLWRSDGCALDWVLDRDNGTYREWWPTECSDRAAFAKSVSARCRSKGSDRRVLSVKQLPDVVEVAWTTIVEVQPPPPPKKLVSNTPPRQATTSTSADRAPVAQSRPRIGKPTRSAHNGAEEGRQTIKTTSKPDPIPPTTTAVASPPEADDFALLTLWHGYRTNAPNETIRQLAQERIDQIMKKIEENSRKAMMSL